MWIFLTIIVVIGILTDTYIKKQKLDLKRIEKELELEKLRIEAFDKETDKLRLELEQTKQLRLSEREEK